MRLSIMGVLLCTTLVACVDVMPQKDFNLEKVRERDTERTDKTTKESRQRVERRVLFSTSAEREEILGLRVRVERGQWIICHDY